MLLAFIGLYILSTLAIGWWASTKVKSTQDFVVAGQNMPLVVAASALFATWFGSETMMGASSEFVEHGLIGVIEDPFGASLCLFLVGIFFARPLYRMNILTFNDYFRIRFGKQSEFVSAVFMIPSYFGWIAAQLLAMAIILKVIAGVPEIYGIMISTIVVVFYTYIGGMWAVSITDFVQTVVITIGLLIITYVMLDRVGGVVKLFEESPKGFFNLLPEANFKSSVEYFAAWITIGLGSIPQQDVFQRIMSSKSEQTAVRASYLSALMYLFIAMLPLIIAYCGKVLYPEILKDDAQMLLPQMVLQHGSLFLQIMFFGALLSAIMSTTSGAILAPATVLGENLIKPYYKEELSDKKLLLIMRLSVIMVAIISAFMAVQGENIFDLVAQSSALSLVSLFMPLAAGLYWKKASNAGSLLSMIFGMAVWIYCEWMVFEYPSLVYGLIASITGMVLGTLIWKREA